MKLLLASYNQGKLLEMQALLDDLHLELLLPSSLNLILDIDEDGQTYQDNAARKALVFAETTGYLSLADDSGLEVDALGGQPGLHSRRFSANPGATDHDRRVLLLQKLQEKKRPWTARFRCVVAIASPARKVWFSEGICEGEIIPEERGQNGFGYDPVFLLPQLGKTMAELSMEDKNHLSHRARAVMAARRILQNLAPAP